MIFKRVSTLAVAAGLTVAGAMESAASGDGTSIEENSTWQVVELAGTDLIAESMPEIQFGESGRIGLTGGCNRFMGQVEMDGSSLMFPENMAGTLMACPPQLEDQEKAFLAALGRVASYRIEGKGMMFLDADGEPVMALTMTE
ncbi:MAG: META domain-containing protein [Rhodobacteraceae bacterium]|nr:META domain-containing protein [Paracoccaceae bacterium]